MNDLWNQLAARANVTLSEAQHAQLARYLDLLLDANQRMNLTRITDRAAAEVQHVGDALTVLPFLPAAGAIRLADVGSGGGVPGIPLAIARPDARVMLVESTKKKAAFLKQAAAELGLSNVSVSEWRAEDVGRSNSRETFDVAVARAVATLDWLAEWCLPLAKPGGRLLAMKGARAAEEVPAAARAIKLLGGGPAVVHPVDLPGSEHRVIVEVPKVARTADRFPRPATQAKGKPLA
ncbi:MAG: 16S rRNA (guanine(527)-N(7))-methyltransferase [uncultured Phycisphaerae bacterium]|uniref:Ribosomal RNA small subunit methyltransferase G n=1 Tax=uncultured Phycisphaerae bacterium TaxID=904963 RepID=A0A6J4PRU3_9BACT|nr:MAG: 16S rRNA (guanine(527)-N(7))-methyltransferase [uncultured Phycisphaerae bacterium]